MLTQPQARAPSHTVGCGQAETRTSPSQYKARGHRPPERRQLDSGRHPHHGKVGPPILACPKVRGKQAQNCSDHHDDRERAHRISAGAGKPKQVPDFRGPKTDGSRLRAGLSDSGRVAAATHDPVILIVTRGGLRIRALGQLIMFSSGGAS